MGERVYVTSGEPRVEPPPVEPRPVEPINYATRVPSPFEERLAAWVARRGGWPQLIFAGGLGLVAASLAMRGYGLFAFTGGLMIGLVLRVPLRKEW